MTRIILKHLTYLPAYLNMNCFFKFFWVPCFRNFILHPPWFIRAKSFVLLNRVAAIYLQKLWGERGKVLELILKERKEETSIFFWGLEEVGTLITYGSMPYKTSAYSLRNKITIAWTFEFVFIIYGPCNKDKIKFKHLKQLPIYLLLPFTIVKNWHKNIKHRTYKA